jgi:hypothetical protein
MSGLFHPQRISAFKLTWSEADRGSSEIIIGDSIDKSLSSDFKFYGSIPSGIVYARCLSWNLKGSICDTREKRKVLRQLIYQTLVANGIVPVKSFFPLGMQHIREVIDDSELAKYPLANYKTLKVFYRKKVGNIIFETIRKHLPKAAGALGLGFQEIEMNTDQMDEAFDPNFKTYRADIAIHATGVLVEDPALDIRFMILSKEGIRLPDTDGRLHNVLENPDFSPQEINEIIWDQAVVFPIGHFAAGVWAKKQFDFSMLNTVLPPIEFQWIGTNQ